VSDEQASANWREGDASRLEHDLLAAQCSPVSCNGAWTCSKNAYKPKPPFRAVLASWVELLNSQAGGGHNYEDVRCILTRTIWWDNTAK
jgi:hypothetical protein